MPKFNTNRVRPARTATGPIQTDPVAPPTPNHEGGTGWTRTPQSELFLLATTSHDITAASFYEGGKPSVTGTVRRPPAYGEEPMYGQTDPRINRFRHLVQQCAIVWPEWTHDFLVWLRTGANIRTAAVVGAVEAARAMVNAGIPGGRQVLADVLTRPDEPGEAIAYHLAVYGRKMPMPVKKGIRDAAQRLYSERSLLKWDTASHGVRFGDVLELCHPQGAASSKDPLYRYALDRRHGRDNVQQIVGSGAFTALPTVYANIVLRSKLSEKVSWDRVTPQNLIDAGMTWEDVLSLAGPDVNKYYLWRNLIPAMGFMARLRNLRNFDEHSLTDADVADVLHMLTDEEQVRASRQLPLRFLSAHRAVSHLRWAYPLERALEFSLTNVPALPGNSLILVDTSGSMNEKLSAKSDLKRWDAAAAFGLAVARRCETAAVVSYSSAGWSSGQLWKQFPQIPGESLLTAIKRWQTGGYFIGGGTDTVGALKETFNPKVHHRVILLTDEQNQTGRYGATVDSVLPATTPLYTWNLSGYRTGHTVSNPYRITLGGLTDAMFQVIPMVERGISGTWPWEHGPKRL
jgi:hypothetical protein